MEQPKANWLHVVGSYGPGWMQRMVAEKTDDRDILERLAESRDDFVRFAVAGNPRTPVTAQAMLSRDYFVSVRMTVARVTTSGMVLEAIAARSPEFIVLREVASNLSTPRATLVELRRVEDRVVSEIAAGTLAVQAQMPRRVPTPSGDAEREPVSTVADYEFTNGPDAVSRTKSAKVGGAR